MKAILVFFGVIAACLAAPSTRNLEDDFQDFVALVPLDELRAILNDHLANDEEFKTVIRYLQSDKWAELYAAVASKTEVQEFKQYLIDAGVDVDALIERIRDWINNAETKTGSGRGLSELVEEVKDALPLDELKALFREKLENSADFQEFYGKVSSEKAHQLVEEIRQLEEVQRIAAALLEYGIDLKKVLDYIYGLFGWE